MCGAQLVEQPAPKKQSKPKAKPAATKASPKPVTQSEPQVSRAQQKAYLVCDRCGSASYAQYQITVQPIAGMDIGTTTTKDESMFRMSLSDGSGRIYRHYLPQVTCVVSHQTATDRSAKIVKCSSCRAETSHHEQLLTPSQVKGTPKRFDPHQSGGCFGVFIVLVGIGTALAASLTRMLG